MLLEYVHCRWSLRNDHGAARILVQAVNDPRARWVVIDGKITIDKEPFHQCGLVLPSARVNNKSGLLVHDNDRIVLIQNVQFECSWDEALLLWQLAGDRLTRADAVRWLGDHACSHGDLPVAD